MGNIVIVNGAPAVAAKVRASCQNLLVHTEDYIGSRKIRPATITVQWDALVICATGNTTEVIALCKAIRSDRTVNNNSG